MIAQTQNVSNQNPCGTSFASSDLDTSATATDSPQSSATSNPEGSDSTDLSNLSNHLNNASNITHVTNSPLEGEKLNTQLTDGQVISVAQTALKLIHVSKSSPCLHCGKPDWCYSIGELTVCKRRAQAAVGWVKTRKQDQEGDDFYAREKTTVGSNKTQRFIPKKSRQEPKPVPLPSGELEIAVLSSVPTDTPLAVKAQIVPKRVREYFLSKGVTLPDLELVEVTTYDYGDGKKSHRYQAPLLNSDKGYEKTFSVSRTDESGQTRWDKGKNAWNGYKEAEAVLALKGVTESKIAVQLGHEGEKCVEACRLLKLAGITPLGNSSVEDKIFLFNEIKTQLNGRQFIYAHCQDNDEAGVKRSEKLALAAARCGIPFVAIDLKAILPDLCDKGDVVDVLACGMDGDQLVEKILEEIRSIRLEQERNAELEEEDHQSEIPVHSSSTNPEAFYKPVCQQMGLPFVDCVTATAFDTWVYHREFSSAENWRVIDSAFFKWSEEKEYWQHQPDNRINTKIADIGEEAFKVSYSKDFGWRYSKPYGTNRNKESAFKYVRSRLERPEPLPANTHLAGMRNCVVDLRTGQQMPHRKEYFLTNIIPYDYEPNKPCPEVFRQFVIESFGEDMLSVIRAFTSMFLDPTAPYGRFPHLIGQSGGGKGTLGRFWSSLFGDEGSGSAAHFADISTPEGRHQYLTGKRIFGFPDVGGYAEGVRAFYELIDNGAMSGRALFNPVAYSKQWYMRFWVASVDHLQIENAGDGWARRNYPIPVLSRTVNPDPDLRMKLEECKADVISWALAMPRETRDRILLSPPESERAVSLALDAALYGDSTKSFVDACLRPDASAEYVPHHQLHTWYVAYCREYGYTPLAMRKFISHLKTVLPRNSKDRHWSPSELGLRHMIPAHFKYIAPLPEIFRSSEPSNENLNQNPIWTCIKSKCEDGGLTYFEEFWQPKSPESIHSLPVQVVQVTEDARNEGVQAESHTQQACTGCTVVQIELRDPEKENSSTNFEPVSNLPSTQPQSNGEQPVQSVQSLPERVSGCTVSLQGSKETVQGVQSLPERVSEFLKPLEFNLSPGDRIRCYPSRHHEENRWSVMARVETVESDNGWFRGCTIEYHDKKKRSRGVRIAGGNANWILGKA